MKEKIRLDLYLFRARLYKSRSQASKAAREGRILIRGKRGAPSTEVQEGDLLRIREKGLYRDIRIIQMPGKNMSRADASTTWQDETPDEVTEQREIINLASRVRGPKREGARPTKKERRNIEKIRGRS
ncbi:MAG: S4 domain-containing protein [Candidatus Electryonea clarkiae]|nr:S4 domain-containing protein [Candidatus Electryonea clarkiae]MDP8288571.1 S4 domain-containing protein [Candidatus Electryonea clarkiae]